MMETADLWDRHHAAIAWRCNRTRDGQMRSRLIKRYCAYYEHSRGRREVIKTAIRFG